MVSRLRLGVRGHRRPDQRRSGHRHACGRGRLDGVAAARPVLSGVGSGVGDGVVDVVECELGEVELGEVDQPGADQPHHPGRWIARGYIDLPGTVRSMRTSQGVAQLEQVVGSAGDDGAGPIGDAGGSRAPGRAVFGW